MLVEPGILEAFGLHLVRSSALVLSSPLLGTGSNFSGYKIALILALSVLTFSASGEPLDTTSTPLSYAVLALREVAIGATFGFCLQLVLTGLRAGTDLVGQEMAFQLGGAVDPITGQSSPPVTHLYETLFFLALLSVDAHQWLIRALAASYERAPVGDLAIGGGLPSTIIDFFGQLFTAGVAFAAPVLVLLFVVSLVIALLARAVPQVNVLEFGFSLRIVGGLVGLALFSPVLAPAMGRLLELLMLGLEAGLDSMTL